MLNVNTAIYSAQGIDVNNVAKVSSQILKEASSNSQPQVQAIDYSKFNRATLGIDLYSSRTNVDLQKQIAITQAGLYAQAVNVAQLNSAAAASLYSANTVAKNVELTQSIQAQELIAPQKITEETSKIQIFNITDKNSRSSNGFNPFNANEENLNQEESEKDTISLFA
ncbi:MAG: hypothetical protein IKU37_07660 [Candidatus Gastranaerophilales bacterium]|nr:hypothetical protein [Candidatus Gastranaerophilales bacterium]